MGNEQLLSTDEKDCLEEIVNISFGLATSLIADMFECFATLKVPSLEIIKSTDLNKHMVKRFDHKEDLYLASQAFKGSFEGETIFFIENQSTINLVKLLFKINEIDKTEIDIEQNDIDSSILEISNIVSSSCLGKIGDLLKTSIMFSSPIIEYKENQNEMFDNDLMDCEQVIIIETVLEFKDHNIKAYLAILPSKISFGWLKNSLQEFLSSYGA